MKRVIVALKKNGEHKLPAFSDCLVDFFTKDAQWVTVDCKLEDNILTLTESSVGVKLQVSLFIIFMFFLTS